VIAREEGKRRRLDNDTRRLKLKDMAQKVANGDMTTSQAIAKLANLKVSSRTIYRFVAAEKTQKRQRFTRKGPKSP
jgi:predicted DNA-binding transcriptional regulator YafY